jgi:hypothetical protein
MLAIVKKATTMAKVTRKNPKVAKKAGSTSPSAGTLGSGEYTADAPVVGSIAVPNASQKPPNRKKTTAGKVFPERRSKLATCRPKIWYMSEAYLKSIPRLLQETE